MVHNMFLWFLHFWCVSLVNNILLVHRYCQNVEAKSFQNLQKNIEQQLSTIKTLVSLASLQFLHSNWHMAKTIALCICKSGPVVQPYCHSVPPVSAANWRQWIPWKYPREEEAVFWGRQQVHYATRMQNRQSTNERLLLPVGERRGALMFSFSGV